MLNNILDELKLNALVITDPYNMRHVSGFRGGCMMMHSPRMRGGQPDFVVDAYTTLFFSLHMQGCSFFTTQNAWRKSHERFCQQTTNHSEDIRFG